MAEWYKSFVFSPCPHCGGRKVSLSFCSGPLYKRSCFVKCPTCGCRGPLSLYGDNGDIHAEDSSFEGLEGAALRAIERWYGRTTKGNLLVPIPYKDVANTQLLGMADCSRFPEGFWDFAGTENSSCHFSERRVDENGAQRLPPE